MTTKPYDLFTAGPIENADAAKLAEVKEIIEQNLFPIFAGMVSSELFSKSPNHGAIESYLRLKHLLDIHGGCNASEVNAVQDYKLKNPREFARIIGELEFQVSVQSLRRRGGRIFDQLFHACANLLLTSPLCSDNPTKESVREYAERIRQGKIHIEG